MHRAVQHRVVLVVERAADVGDVDAVGSDTDPSGQRRRDRCTGEDRRALRPHAFGHRRTDIERRHLESGRISRPGHERDVALAAFDGDVELLDRPPGHGLGAEAALLRILVLGVDGDERLVGATQPQAGVGQHLLDRIGQRCREPIADVRRERVAQPLGDLGDRADQLRIVEDPPHDAGQRRESPRCDLDADGVAHDVLEDVGLVEDDDVVIRENRPAARHVEAVQVGVDHDHVRSRGSPTRLLGEAGVAQRAAIGAGALVAADAHRAPRVVRRRPVEFCHVARGRAARPLGEPLDLDPRGQCHGLEFELALVAGAHLPQPLQAHVVRAALQHGPVEIASEVFGEEREVLRGQLILEGLGRRRHHDSGVGLDRRDQVGEGLAGTGTRLDDQMSSVRDRRGDEFGHLLLAEALLCVGESGGDPGERVAHRASANAASSSCSSKSGQGASVK